MSYNPFVADHRDDEQKADDARSECADTIVEIVVEQLVKHHFKHDSEQLLEAVQDKLCEIVPADVYARYLKTAPEAEKPYSLSHLQAAG